MKLWTMQTRDVWERLQRTGVYRCDTALCWMAADFPHAYTWLSREMTERVGSPPQGVIYPVWAWYMQNGKHKKPDLRSERWDYGAGGEDYCCIELEIAPERVLLSDFDEWHIVLNNGLISNTEEEDVAQEAFYYESLSDEEKIAYKEKTGSESSTFLPSTTAGRRAANGCRRRSGNSGARMSAPCAFFARASTSALPKRDEGRFDGTEKPPPLLSEEAAFAVGTALNPPTARARR